MLIKRRTFFAVVFSSLLDGLDTATPNEKCPVMTATLDCDISFLYVWHANGTLWNGGFHSNTISDCYDKNECYIVEAIYAKQDCWLQVVMDETTALKETLSTETTFFTRSVFFVGKCDIQCPGETTLLLTNGNHIVSKDIDFSLHTLDKGVKKAVIRYGEMVTLCIDLEA